MKTPKVFSKASFGLRRAGRVLKKHSPEILMGIGTVGVITGTVLACKATTKAEDIIFDSQESIDPEDDPKEIKRIKRETYCDVAKAYAPSVIIMVLSIGSMWGSNYIYRKRCAELAAAYTAVNAAFMEYRKAIREKFGVDVDREIMTGGEMVTITEYDENGKKSKKKALSIDDLYSPYARFFEIGRAHV